MKAVVGLGNPGPRYAQTRHNVGFMVADELVDRRGGAPFHGEPGMLRTTVGASAPDQPDVTVMKPTTWMNRSGEAVASLAARFDVRGEDLIVVHDDLDLEQGTVRIKVGGGHGGHNGLRSILATEAVGEFVRVRLGVARTDRARDAAEFVLEQLTDNELASVRSQIERATAAVEKLLDDGPGRAMNEFNRRPSKAADDAAEGAPEASAAGIPIGGSTSRGGDLHN